MYLEYLEKPVTSEEKAVAELLHRAMNALRKGDAEGLLSVFSEEARIVPSFSKRTDNFLFSKEAYRKHLANHPFPGGVYRLRNVLIRVFENKKEASAQALLCPMFSPSGPHAVRRDFHCVKLGEQWFIDRALNEL